MPPIALLIDLLLYLVLPALITSAALIGLAVALLNRKWWDLAVAVALIGGMLAGNYSRASLPYIPDGYGWPWLLPAAIAITLLAGMGQSCWPKKIVYKALLIIAGTIALTCVLTPVENHRAEYLLGFAAISLANAFVLEAVSERSSSRLLYVLAPFVFIKGAALVSIYSHFARVTDGAAIVASSLLGILVISFWKSISFKVAGQLLAILLPALMLSAQQNTYSEVPLASFFLIALSPLALLPVLVPRFKKLAPRTQLAIQIILPIIPVLIAVGLAIKAEGFAIGY